MKKKFLTISSPRFDYSTHYQTTNRINSSSVSIKEYKNNILFSFNELAPKLTKDELLTLNKKLKSLNDRNKEKNAEDFLSLTQAILAIKEKKNQEEVASKKPQLLRKMSAKFFDKINFKTKIKQTVEDNLWNKLINILKKGMTAIVDNEGDLEQVISFIKNLSEKEREQFKNYFSYESYVLQTAFIEFEERRNVLSMS